MSIGGREYSIYFAWVPGSDIGEGTAWDPSFARFDENIFDLLVEHDEGQIPTATIEIKNPHIGFIAPGRLYWAWISFAFEACPPQPLFYGRLVGIPEQIEQNTVKMKFIARAPDYVYQKQQVARSLKVAPNYDEIFFDVTKRDDPDAILEGWSALYHVDRVNNRVSASDILVGEDGTITFAAQDVFYDSVQCKILQSPLVAVNVKAEVQWEQQYRGTIYVGQWAYPTLGGDAFVGDWPKSGASLGGGWSAGISWAGERDPDPVTAAMATQKPLQTTYTYSWTNKAKQHQFGDTMSISLSFKPPFGEAIVVGGTNQVGIQNPYNEDAYGNPAPLNIPAKLSMDYFCYKRLALDFLGKESVATLELVYNANRKRSERLEMTVQADVQPVLIDPLVTEDTEQVTVKSGDLSLPIVNMQNWDSIGYGGAVNLGDCIFPDNPLVPGQTSSQICVQAGNTGMVFPTFSNIAGVTTTDGTVIWASLGDTPPTDGSQDWVRDARVPLGTLLLPKPVSGLSNFQSALIPGQLNFPPTGFPAAKYAMYCEGDGGPGDTIMECTEGGMVGGLSGYGGGLGIGQQPPGGGGSFLPAGPIPADPASFQTFRNPTGAFLYISIQAGVTGDFHTTFNETPGTQTTDGTVIWQNIGPANLPIGGWPGMTPAAVYFPTDRGLISVQHMFCRARAKLRKRARAVDVSFDTRFEVAAQLSCRMNGTVSDIRLPGGTASGKVISYKLEAHGDSGMLGGKVTLGCSIGGDPIPFPGLPSPPSPPPTFTDPGVPGYVQAGYVQGGYQQYYSSVSGAPPGTLAQQGVSFYSPFTPPNWPTLPPTLPPTTCPPLNSIWSAGPSDLSGNEIGYTPPANDPNDDGVTFPATGTDLILSSMWHGLASTVNPLNIDAYNLEIESTVHDAIRQATTTTSSSIDTPDSSASSSISIPASPLYDIDVAVRQAVIQKLLQGTGLWYELTLKPLTNGPFSNYYVINTTELLVPQTVDLSAPSSGGLLTQA